MAGWGAGAGANIPAEDLAALFRVLGLNSPRDAWDRPPGVVRTRGRSRVLRSRAAGQGWRKGKVQRQRSAQAAGDPGARGGGPILRPWAGCAGTAVILGLALVCRISSRSTSRAVPGPRSGAEMPALHIEDLPEKEKLKMEVEQLRKEVKLQRQQVSKCSEEIKNYIEERSGEDPLVKGIPEDKNPFKEKGSCIIS